MIDLLLIKNSFCGADERAGKSGRAGSYGKEFWVENNLISLLLIGIKNRFCEKDGQEVEVDSRTSDALALAVRFNCPIFTYEFILESAGAIINEPENKEGSDEEDEENESVETLSTSISPQSDLSKLTIKELNEKLGELLDKEDYEAAARIRDELDRRKK